MDRGGRILANADAGHAQDFGRFIHGYSATGLKEASWGREEVVIRADLQSRVRHLASGQDGFWAMRSNSYRIERWADSGALQLELQRRDPAFPSYRRNDVTPQTPSKPVYVDLQEVEPDVLAVLVLVPDRRWKAATRFEKSAHGSSFSWTDLDVAFDTMVEFIDTRRGVLLQSQRFDEVATQFVGPSLIALIDDRPDSAAVLRLARVSLHRQ